MLPCSRVPGRTEPEHIADACPGRLGLFHPSRLPHYEVYLGFLGPRQYLTTKIYANEIMSNLGKGMKC